MQRQAQHIHLTVGAASVCQALPRHNREEWGKSDKAPHVAGTALIPSGWSVGWFSSGLVFSMDLYSFLPEYTYEVFWRQISYEILCST